MDRHGKAQTPPQIVFLIKADFMLFVNYIALFAVENKKLYLDAHYSTKECIWATLRYGDSYVMPETAAIRLN